MNSGEFYEFLEGVSKRVDEVIVDTKDITPSFMATGLFKEVMADDVAYNTKGATGLGYAQSFDEEDGISYDKTYPMYGTSYIVKQYGLGTVISQMLSKVRPAVLDEKIGEVRQHRISMNKTMNNHAWQVFRDAFVATDSVASLPVARLDDGVAMISASHPSKVSGVAVRSNVVVSAGVTNPALGETALFDAIKMLREQKDARGLQLEYSGKVVLLVPTALEKTAREITGSVLRSGTANNDINYFANGSVDVISSVHLGAAAGGSDTAWFVVGVEAPEEYKPFRYVKLIDPKIEQDVDFDTKNIKVSVDAAYSFGYSSWEYVVGSTGLLS